LARTSGKRHVGVRLPKRRTQRYTFRFMERKFTKVGGGRASKILIEAGGKLRPNRADVVRAV